MIEFSNNVACRGLWPGGKKTGAASSPEDLKRLMNVKQFAIENGDL